MAGQCAVVVGAGGGIGQATCILLASRGVQVVGLDRDREAAEETVAAIKAGTGTATAHVADVTDPASLETAFAQAVAAHDQVHVVINTAGIQGQLGKPSHEVSLEDFDRVYAINLRGALAVTQMALPHMLEHGYGRISQVASIAGKEGNPNMVSYSATKAGLIGMVKAQGKEYATSGITINALAPAVIRTPFLDSQPQQVIDFMTAKIPAGRMGTVEEAAAMLAWMSSPECSFTTGFTFDLSGGRATY